MYKFSKIQIINSKGLNILDEKERGRVGVSCVAADQGKIEFKNFSFKYPSKDKEYFITDEKYCSLFAKDSGFGLKEEL